MLRRFLLRHYACLDGVAVNLPVPFLCLELMTGEKQRQYLHLLANKHTLVAITITIVMKLMLTIGRCGSSISSNITGSQLQSTQLLRQLSNCKPTNHTNAYTPTITIPVRGMCCFWREATVAPTSYTRPPQLVQSLLISIIISIVIIIPATTTTFTTITTGS